MFYITSVSYAIMLNGSSLEFLHPNRGFCQGDLLSPYLCILCVEYLSSLIRQAEADHKIYGTKIQRVASSISYLFLVDEILVFYQANMNKVESFKQILLTYSIWSTNKF